MQLIPKQHIKKGKDNTSRVFLFLAGALVGLLIALAGILLEGSPWWWAVVPLVAFAISTSPLIFPASWSRAIKGADPICPSAVRYKDEK